MTNNQDNNNNTDEISVKNILSYTSNGICNGVGDINHEMHLYSLLFSEYQWEKKCF